MRLKPILFEEVSEEDKKYFTSEGCPYFSLALNDIFGYAILLLVDQARMWDENFHMIPHVYCEDKNLNPVDVKGKRESFSDLLDEFYEVQDPESRYVERRELIEGYMGPNKPFFKLDEEEVQRAKKIIRNNRKLYN